MTAEEIYETALYLAEKTDDSNGFIDNEYKNAHKQRALEIIRQSIIKIAATENINIITPEKLEYTDEIRLPVYILKTVIPCYVAAMLCRSDGEEENYNLLIYEYQQGLCTIKHDEEAPEVSHVLEGLV